MSLFVGNISKNVKRNDITDEFEKYGKCDISFKGGSYAFIEYDNDRDAEDAMEDLQGKDMGGLKLNIEWSKKSGRYDAKNSKRPSRTDRDDLKCYNCNRYGHFARDCRGGRRGRSRSRSRSRRDRRRTRSRSGGRRRYSKSPRSRTRSRSLSRSRSKGGAATKRISGAEKRKEMTSRSRSPPPQREKERKRKKSRGSASNDRKRSSKSVDKGS